MTQVLHIVKAKKEHFLAEKQTIDNFTWKYEIRCRIQALRESLKTMSLMQQDFKAGINELEDFINHGPKGGAA